MNILKADCLNNWGDNFTEVYFREVHGRDWRGVEEFEFGEPMLVGCGSVLGRVSGREVAVLGTGLMYSRERADLRNSRVYAVRGKLTARRCFMSEEQQLNIVCGDLGLLASDLPFSRQPKAYRYGIIPHYTDRENGDVVHWSRRDDTLVIDIRSGVKQVLSAASSCETIVSSSLHGLVLADSLGIPSSWVELGDRVAGGGFKFRDYYSVYDESPESFCIADGVREARTRDVEPVKQRLREAVARFLTEFA